MKYSQYAGVFVTLILIGSCFVNWTWYPDIQKYFTGFFSVDNIYGKPGKVFIFMSVLAIFFFLVPRVWAKRWNMMVCGLTLAYAIKTFILYSSCYRGICPDKQPGLWVMLFSAALMMVATLMPDMKLRPTQEQE